MAEHLAMRGNVVRSTAGHPPGATLLGYPLPLGTTDSQSSHRRPMLHTRRPEAYVTPERLAIAAQWDTDVEHTFATRLERSIRHTLTAVADHNTDGVALAIRTRTTYRTHDQS